MPDRVLLTDRRKELLSEGYDPSNATERGQKHRLKESTHTAFGELIEIAESPYIDNSEFFDANDVGRLIGALLTPSINETESGGLVGGDLDQDRPEVADLSDDFQQFRDKLYLALDDPMHTYRDGRFSDPSE